MISIELNKQLDYEVYRDFRDFCISGVNFGALIKSDHPDITPANYKEYIDNYYGKFNDGITFSLNELSSLLLKQAGSFFDATKKYFMKDYRNKQYTGYLSIFNCNPRFLENSSFQFFYRKPLTDQLSVCFHEILHFIFFDFCRDHFSKEVVGLNANSGKLWELSEIFNVIILNEPTFRQVLGREEKLFYPQLSNQLIAAQRVWNDKEQSVRNTIEVLITHKGESV